MRFVSCVRVGSPVCTVSPKRLSAIFKLLSPHDSSSAKKQSRVTMLSGPTRLKLHPSIEINGAQKHFSKVTALCVNVDIVSH